MVQEILQRTNVKQCDDGPVFIHRISPPSPTTVLHETSNLSSNSTFLQQEATTVTGAKCSMTKSPQQRWRSAHSSNEKEILWGMERLSPSQPCGRAQSICCWQSLYPRKGSHTGATGVHFHSLKRCTAHTHRNGGLFAFPESWWGNWWTHNPQSPW